MPELPEVETVAKLKPAGMAGFLMGWEQMWCKKLLFVVGAVGTG